VHGLDLSVHEHKCDATAAADDNCSQNDALVWWWYLCKCIM